MAFLFFVAAVVLFFLFAWQRSELNSVRSEVEFLRSEVTALRTYVTQLWQFLENDKRAAAEARAAETGAAETQESVVETAAAVEDSPSSESIEQKTPFESASLTAPLSAAEESSVDGSDETAEEVAFAPADAPTPEPQAARERIDAAPTSEPKRAFDWEDMVGVRLFSAIAGVALVLAALFFLRYSVERGWLVPAVRAAIGLASGIALLVVCELKVARGYRFTANAMHGAGVAILYATLYAMYAVWQLAPAAVVFPLMLVVTAIAVMLSIRRDSVFIAILGMLGGFATPALLSSGENRPLVLFSYLMLLNVGLSWVAYKKRWPALTLGSVMLTVIYEWAWVDEFLDATQLPLAAAIFLLFGVAASYALWSARASEGDTAQKRFERVALTGVVLPLAFGLFTAAIPSYGARFNTLFAFLLLVCSGLAVIALRRGHEWLHTLGGAAAVATFALWSVVSYPAAAWPGVLAWLAAFVVLYLAVATRREWVGNATVPALLLVFTLLIGVEDRTANGWLLFATLLVLLAASAMVALVWRRSGQYVGSAMAVVIALSVWTIRHLEEDVVAVALTTYAAFAVLLLTAGIVARRTSVSVPVRRAAWLAFAAHVMMLSIAGSGVLSDPPAPLFVALGVVLVAGAIASLLLGSSAMFTTMVIATHAVLFAWAAHVDDVRLQMISFAAALIVAAFALAWLAPTRGRGAFERSTIAALLGAHVVAMTAGANGEMSILAPLLATHLLLAVATAALAWRTGRHGAVVLSAAFTALAVALAPTDGAGFTWRLAFATAIYAVYVAYPLLVGARAGRSILPALAAVLQSVAYFFAARQAIVDAGYDGFIGFLPIGQMLAMLAIVVRIVRFEAASDRNVKRLALVGGTALAFLTLAVPLQLDHEWITIAWALEGAALLWLFQRVPYRGLLWWSGALLAVVFVRLAMNAGILEYYPSSTPILNWYLYTYLLCAAAFFAAARLTPRDVPKGSSAAAAAGTILLFVLLNIEIADFFSPAGSRSIEFWTTSVAQGLTYTVAWGLFALGLLIAGIIRSSRPARIAALALLVVTIFKCFLHDLGDLEGLYRIGSLLGLAACLVAVGLLIQRFVIRPRTAAGQPA